MSLTLFERALVAHLVADWLLQNDWMAHQKTSLSHSAAWVHGAFRASRLRGRSAGRRGWRSVIALWIELAPRF